MILESSVSFVLLGTEVRFILPVTGGSLTKTFSALWPFREMNLSAMYFQPKVLLSKVNVKTYHIPLPEEQNRK